MSTSEQIGVSASQANTGELVVRNLRVLLNNPREPQVALIERVDLALPAGRRMALVGESGSGKSVTAMATMGLTDYPLSSSVEHLYYGGRDLAALDPQEWRDVRGPILGLIQQDPLTALSPVFSVGSQIAEPLRRHRGLSRRAAWHEALERMQEVGIPDPHRRSHDYPHQLSGGLRQRVAIALALAASPAVIFADEPTTALDVTVQAQIIELMIGLSEDRGMGIVFITHDLGLLPGFVHDVSVMYSGRIVETGAADLVLHEPRHPYTAALLAAQPGNLPSAPKRKLATIPGLPPSPAARPQGCAFAARCPLATDVCRQTRPELRVVANRSTACHHAESVTIEGL